MTEKKTMQVSYSAIDTYLSCSEKYRLERILKIIPDTINTAFMFGKSIDSASEVIFKPFMKDGPTFDREEMLKVFKEQLTNIDYQGEILYAPTHPKVKYSKADVQAELLEYDDNKAIREFVETTDLILDHIPKFIDYFKDTKIKIEDEVIVYNFIAWHCLYRKGILMLDALKKWADENVKEVISLQRKIEIINDNGDNLVGYIDLEAVLKSDNILRTIDLKTASQPKQQYPDHKISESMQLAIYAECSQPEVGYVILDKVIKKKAPRVAIRELRGTITEEQLDETFETIDKAMSGIRAGKFEKNTDSCFAYGKCSFYNLCHGGSMKGLVERIKKEEK